MITRSCPIRTMLTKFLEHFRRAKAIRLPCHRADRIGQRTSSRYSPSGRRMDTSRKARSRAAEALGFARDGAEGIAILLESASGDLMARAICVHVGVEGVGPSVANQP